MTDGHQGRPDMERRRQFKFRLSDDEWEKLLIVAEEADAPAADVFRAFIERRYEELMQPELGASWDECSAAADTLLALSRRVRSLGKGPDRGRR